MMESARLTPPKLEVACKCGKRYRVGREKAGKRFRCKNCRLKVRIPEEDSGGISLRTRRAILAEVGIDPETAEKEFESGKKNYRCTLCNLKLKGADFEGAYGPEGLVCSPCRETISPDQESEVDETPSSSEPKKKKKKKELESWSTQGTERDAKIKAAGFGTLFLVGIGCFIHSIFSPAIPVTILVASAAAGLGAQQIYKGNLPDAQPAGKASERKAKGL
jgi:hypothetical protein